MILLYVFLWLVVCFGLIIIVAFSMENKRRFKDFNAQYDKAQQMLQSARAKYDANLAHLKSIGFQIDQTKKMANRTFYFDYQKRLTAYETHGFDERHLHMRPTKQKLFDSGAEIGDYYTRINNTGQSFCTDIKVFPDDKIIECALLQDGAVVKKSEGSAALAGVSIPYFGSLQGDG